MYNKDNAYYIEGNVPSLKNGKRKTRFGLIPSKAVQKYNKLKAYQYETDEIKEYFKRELEGVEFPIKLHMYMIRDSKRRFDYINIAQLPLDLMVKNHLLPDDSAMYVIPVFDGYHVDRQHAGIWFSIEKKGEQDGTHTPTYSI